MSMSKAAKQMRAARMQVMLQQPFFGSLLMNAPFIEKRDIPTASTDMRSIFYNPEFIEKQTSNGVKFVLGHEVLHKSMCHGLRRQQRDPRLWNVACDYAVNIILQHAGFEVLDGALIDKRFDGRSAEEIYEILNSKTGGNGGIDGDTCEVIGYDLDEPNMSGDDKAMLEQEIKQQVAQAVTTARLSGKFPAALERAISALLEPQVPWSDILREYMVRIAYDNESWSRRNRRIQHAFLPSRYNPAMGPIVIIGDTSGSISDSEFNKIATEVQAVSDQLHPENIRVVWADTEVSSEQVFELNEPLDLKPTGGGGTDMRVPLAHVEQYAPQIVILITDGETPWPKDKPDYPLIICCTTDRSAPIGDVIRI